MKKLTRTSTKPPAANRVAQLVEAQLAKVIGGCTNENLTTAVIK